MQGSHIATCMHARVPVQVDEDRGHNYKSNKTIYRGHTLLFLSAICELPRSHMVLII
jgi:hypothetical protein